MCSKKNQSYFNEFYEAVKSQAETVTKDATMTKWQKMSNDPVLQQRAFNRWVFLQVVDIYCKKNEVNRRGHCEFIQEGLGRMKELGVHRDLSCYKALFKAFPQGSMRTKNNWEAMFRHFPKQQDLAVEVMDRMSLAGVIPDHEFACLVANIFGTKAQAFLKVRRMLYWMPKFKHLNPYKLPHDLPTDAISLALLALKKMAVDMQNVNTVWTITDESVGVKNTFVASSQSVEQRELLARHPASVPLYVEGGFTMWLRDTAQTYFILRAESDPNMFTEPTEEQQRLQDEEVDSIETMFDSEESSQQLAPSLSLHQQPDGTVLAMCITGTSTKDSLISWIRHLQEANPNLEKTPIVFTLRTPEEDGLVTADKHEMATQA